ncbi:MAG: Transcriptional regulator, TetR family [Acidimicrobiales bacterium]|nr:Transcriptional regulator, TetR family [Acidimicrobiales bacterium]
MLGEPTSTWRESRREAAIATILDAAWALARRDGVAALSLSEVARTVGMKPPSLYSYFESKAALYDAMFAQGYREFIARDVTAAMAPGATLRDALRVGMGRFLSFSVEDPARHQLLFQRTIPGFVPSEASMAVANEAYGQTRAYLAAHGITEQADLDLLTAVSTGLADQQISNDPGGDRWLRQLDRAVDMLAAALERRPTRKRGKR